MACASSRATDSTTILSQPAFSPSSGIVFVMISRSIGAASMRCNRRPRQHAVHGAGQHAARAVVLERLRRLLNRAGRVDDVVGQHAHAPAHITDHVHHLGRAVLRPPLVDDRQVGIEPLGVGPRALGAADIGRHDRDRPDVLPSQVVDDDRRGEQSGRPGCRRTPESAPCADPSSAPDWRPPRRADSPRAWPKSARAACPSDPAARSRSTESRP